MRASLPPADDDEAEGSGEGGLAAAPDRGPGPAVPSGRGLGGADPPAGHCADSTRSSAAPGRLGLTRRALLGAAVAVPVAAGVSETGAPSPLPSPNMGEDDPWSLALAAYRDAETARARFEAATSEASAPPGGRDFDEQEALDDEYGLFVNAADAAMLKLLEAPAPGLEGLVVKIGLISAHSVWENDGGEDCLVWLEADARRLAAQGK